MKVKIYTLKDLDTGHIYDYDNKKKLEKDLKNFTNYEVRETINHIHYYIEIHLLNNRGQEFAKGFNDLRSAQLFLNKLRRGNKLTITLIECPDDSILNALNYYTKELK